MKSPERNPLAHGQLPYAKGVKAIQWGKDRLFGEWRWENWIATSKRLKQDPYLRPCTQMDQRAKTTKLLEGNIEGEHFNDLGFGDGLLSITLKETKETNRPNGVHWN